MAATSSDALSSSWHIQLRRILVDYFSEDELETLCFDLRVDYDDLEGESKSQKAVSLIYLLARLGRIEELIDWCSQARPNVPWSDIRLAASQNPLLVEEKPDRAAGASLAPAQRPAASQERTAVSRSPIIWVAVTLLLVVSVAMVFLVLRGAFGPGAGDSPGARTSAPETTVTDTVTETATESSLETDTPTEATTVASVESSTASAAPTAEETILAEEVTRPAPIVASNGEILLSQDFESGEAPDWHDISFLPVQVVVLRDGNNVLALRQGVEALYDPAWDWASADYRLEADIMVMDLNAGTSVGFNARVAGPNPSGYCQGYRAELGQAFTAVHLVTVPENTCDSVWQYDTLANDSFLLAPGEWHHLRLDVVGNRLRLYIDDELTLATADPENTYPSGGIGLIAFETREAYADNILITDLSSAQ